MTSATFNEANNEILAAFKAAWDTTGFVVAYENVKSQDTVPPSGSAPWARVTLRHTFGDQASLASVGGVRRWRRDGLVTVQIFIPLGEGLSEGYSLAKTVVDAFEGTATASSVWFRNVRVNEVGSDGEWYQVNVLADFTYDEVK